MDHQFKGCWEKAHSCSFFLPLLPHTLSTTSLISALKFEVDRILHQPSDLTNICLDGVANGKVGKKQKHFADDPVGLWTKIKVVDVAGEACPADQQGITHCPLTPSSILAQSSVLA